MDLIHLDEEVSKYYKKISYIYDVYAYYAYLSVHKILHVVEYIFFIHKFVIIS